MKEPESLPSSYQEKTKYEPLPRVVCDYIAGMTDNFIFQQHDNFCGAQSNHHVTAMNRLT
jgi:dGTP triphosphohydrolase